jgi:two-component system, OmpR family, sensor kinase
MKRGKRPLLLSPSLWPVRWRLAGVSAGLTFVILLVFALGVGRLVEDRLRDDFRDEVQATARQVALSISVDEFGQLIAREGAGELLDQIPVDTGASFRVVDAAGHTFGSTPDAPQINPPVPGFEHIGTLAMATEQIPTNGTRLPVFIQYARTHDNLDATIDRLWLFLAVGVIGGAILATLAGLWVARRAMSPIAALTATAREIATTRDPSLQMPMPEAEDEVAELARTLDSMLAELDAARGEAQQMVQLQREFVADASHELRTPLTSILANLELLHERLGAEGEDAEMVESALRSSKRMRRLVADLLMLARADAGRLGERGPCDLSEIAEAAAAEVRPVAENHELQLAIDGPVQVEANPDELHRLAVNLLDNAVQHTPPGTDIELSVARHNGSAILEVRDHGPGLPPGLEEQVFSRFVRGAGPADLASASGTGLGLAIVQAVANSHGGSVKAGNAADGGAVFTVILPAAEDPAEAPSKVSANV